MKKLALAVVAAAALSSARAELPEGYEALDGIASTSVGKQYVYTDYVPSSCNITIEAKVTLTTWTTECIWCSRGSTTADKTMTLFGWAKESYFRMDRNANTGTYAKKGATLSTPVVLKADYKTGEFFIDDVPVESKMAGGDFTPVGRLSFFSSHTNGSGWGNYTVMSLHDVKVYDADGNLECEFVPVRCLANAGKATEYGLLEVVRNEKKYFSTPGTAAFEPVIPASAVWSEDVTTDALVLTVTGTYELTAEDCAKITSTAHANFIKRGDGVLVGAPIKAFTGNITVEAGVFRLAHQYDCGADSVGWIRVCDGATLELNGFAGVTNPRAITGKTIYTTGDGYRGMGAIAGGCNWNSCSKCRFILEGDSLYRATSEFAFVDFIDLAGHKLTGMQTRTDQRWGLSGGTSITNSAATAAEFDFTNGLMRVEGSGTGFKGKATDGTVRIRGGKPNGTVVLATSTLTSVWPLEIGPNVLYESRKFSDRSDLTQGGLSGPLTFKGHVELATTVQSGTNSLANIKGTMTGGGEIVIGSGWVNFQTTANDYAGTITAARSDALAGDDLRAGIRVLPGKVYSAAETVLTNADFDVGNGVAEVKSPLHFTGDAQSRLTGGNFSGERTKLGLIRKTGSGELLLSAGVAVTGRLEVAEGTVRLPSRAEYMPVVGKPGLLGSVTNEVCWSFSSPDEGGIPCVYDTVYPHGTDLTSRWDGTGVRGPRTTMVRGYVWNRTGADVTWTFKANHNDRVWFWLDDASVFSNEKETIETRTLTPGPHKFVLITTSSSTSSGPLYVKWVSGQGSLYDSLPVDFSGKEKPAGSDYSQLLDPGDGSLFTIDDKTTEQLDDPFWLAEVGTAAFGPNATFDVGGYDYRLETLEGCPTVTDVGTLTVGRQWLLTEACAGSQKALTVSGTLTFAEGCELDLALDFDKASAATCQAFDAGVTVATATALNGAPTLSAELVGRGATLTASDDGKSLVLRVPNGRYVKPTATGAAVGYAVSAGKPYKEVRIDVYRDGVQIDQRFLGDAYGRFEGAWTYEGDGYYLVFATTRTEDAEERQTFGTVMNEGANIRYVSPGESIIDAVAALGAGGGKVYVRPGTYAENNPTNGVVISAGVQVIGQADDPASVVVTRDKNVKMRIFTVNHPDAALRFLTIQDGDEPWNDYLSGNGGNVFVGENGGTIENCIIKNGSTVNAWAAGGGNVALFNGVVRNCTLVGGACSVDTTNIWVNCGGSLLLFQKAATAAIVVENCLITGCNTANRSGSAPIGLYGGVKLVNCTVAGNDSNISGGTMLYERNDQLPQIVNCAFFDNTMRATPASDSQLVFCRLLNYRNVDNAATDAELAACFVNCAAPVALNDTCLTTDAPLFADAENGDYRLTAESPLLNAGYNTSSVEGIGLFDLIGSPRFVRRVDIGCFEYREPKFERKGALLLVR